MKWYWIVGAAVACLVVATLLAVLLDVGEVRSRWFASEQATGETISNNETRVMQPSNQNLFAEAQMDWQQQLKMENEKLRFSQQELDKQKQELRNLLKNVENLLGEYRQSQASVQELRKELDELKKRQDEAEQKLRDSGQETEKIDQAEAARNLDKDITKIARGIEDNPREGVKLLVGMLEQQQEDHVLAILKKLDESTMIEVLSKLSKNLPGKSRDVADLIQNMLKVNKG